MKLVSVLTTEASGGAEFATAVLLDALGERGHEVVALSNQSGKNAPSRVAERQVALGPKLSRRSWPRVVLRSRFLLRRLRAALREVAPYDVLLLHYKKEQLLAPLLPSSLRARLVWAEWGPVPPPLRRGPLRLAYLAAARRAALVIAVSDATRDSLVGVGVPPEKVVVLPNALRTDEIRFDKAGREKVRERLGIADEAFVVGCVSRFHPKKRNDILVEAVARLGERAELILAGAGETEAQLRELAAQRGVRAHFLGTPTGDLKEVLSAFDVSVFCPSPNEGAPRAVIIAMLAGRPCIATGAEGVRGLIPQGTGEIITPDNDVERLTVALRSYAGDPERRQADGERARAYAEERFDAAAVAQRFEQLLVAL